ncbi:MAG: tetratricopeptide repeat protein [bacterium]|nr:tetratricopeptide repeat protein [bacterium]
MKKLFLYFLSTCLLFVPQLGRSQNPAPPSGPGAPAVPAPTQAKPVQVPVQGHAEEDYRFYKKYGHSSKRWNDSVKQGFESYDRQDCNQAMNQLKAAVAQQCRDPIVFFKLAVCSELLDSPYTAMQYYQLAEETLPQLKGTHRYHKEIYENYGRALFKAKRYKEALPYLTRAAAIGTPSFALFYMVGSLYAKNNDMNAALDYYRRALTQDTSGIDPKLLSKVYLEVARTHYNAKDFKQAAQLLDRAIKLDPSNQEAINLRNNVGTGLQQQSIVEMLQNLSNEGQQTKEPAPQSAPPPPAASKLPPLESGSQDPTPPLGQPR